MGVDVGVFALFSTASNEAPFSGRDLWGSVESREGDLGRGVAVHQLAIPRAGEDETTGSEEEECDAAFEGGISAATSIGTVAGIFVGIADSGSGFGSVCVGVGSAIGGLGNDTVDLFEDRPTEPNQLVRGDDDEGSGP